MWNIELVFPDKSLLYRFTEDYNIKGIETDLLNCVLKGMLSAHLIIIACTKYNADPRKAFFKPENQDHQGL